MVNTTGQHRVTGRKVWTYGDEGAAFPVETGQLWRCGDHWFYSSDLMNASANRAERTFAAVCAPLANGLPGASALPRIVYSDPPWGQGNLNTFQTKAGLDRASYDWRQLYLRIAVASGPFHVKHLYIENSHRDSEVGADTYAALTNSPVTAKFAPEGNRGYWDITYYHRRSNRAGLYHVGSEPFPAALAGDAANPGPLWGRDDDDSPGIVMRAHAPRGIVVDPCAGRGVTSREAERSGWVSFNNELNPYRVSAALARMSKLIGQEPVRIL